MRAASLRVRNSRLMRNTPASIAVVVSQSMSCASKTLAAMFRRDRKQIQVSHFIAEMHDGECRNVPRRAALRPRRIRIPK